MGDSLSLDSMCRQPAHTRCCRLLLVVSCGLTCGLQLVDEGRHCREPHKVKGARQDAVKGGTGNDHRLQEA
jgi:hypothetical protein